MMDDLPTSATPLPIKYLVSFDHPNAPPGFNRYVVLRIDSGKFTEVAAGTLEAVQAAIRLFDIEPVADWHKDMRSRYA